MKIIYHLFCLLSLDIFLDKLLGLSNHIHLYRIGKITGQKIRYVGQSPGRIRIVGKPIKFEIGATSHLKSDTFIESSGGVFIGEYFHTGSGLTIFSTNHNYDNSTKIPYDENSVIKPVIIKDFVWCGANVTIVPGVKIGEGAVIGAGAVVCEDVPDFAIVGGNPSRILKYRNIDHFVKLHENKSFY